MSVKSVFSKRIQQARRDYSLTLKQMAELTGISERNYQNLDYGHSEPSFANALLIAKILNISVDAIMQEVYRDVPSLPRH